MRNICANGAFRASLWALGLAGAWMGAAPARAHDHWINRGGYRDPLFGEQCCGDHDCVPVAEVDVRALPDGYHLASGEIVPYRRTLTSEDGRYWVCRWDVHWEKKNSPIRCFFAPLRSN